MWEDIYLERTKTKGRVQEKRNSFCANTYGIRGLYPERGDFFFLTPQCRKPPEMYQASNVISRPFSRRVSALSTARPHFSAPVTTNVHGIYLASWVCILQRDAPSNMHVGLNASSSAWRLVFLCFYVFGRASDECPRPLEPPKPAILPSSR